MNPARRILVTYNLLVSILIKFTVFVSQWYIAISQSIMANTFFDKCVRFFINSFAKNLTPNFENNFWEKKCFKKRKKSFTTIKSEVICLLTSEWSLRVLTPGLLNFAIFSDFFHIFEKIRPKTLLNPKIFPDCYTFLTFFCNSPGVSTVRNFAKFYNLILNALPNLTCVLYP